MREIKFRAWHKNRKTFLDFDWAVDKLGRTFSILDKCVYDEFTDEIELMQYTGLKDVNGVEIYEGDIVRRIPRSKREKSFVGDVRYGQIDSSFTIHDEYGKDFRLYSSGKYHTYEVIGNIYEKNDCEGK